MYHISLRIVSCCLDPLLQSTFRQLKSHSGCDHAVSFDDGRGDGIPAGIAEADIVLLGPDRLDRMRDMRAAAKSGAFLVFVNSAGRTPDKTLKPYLPFLDDVWQGPDSPDMWRFRVERLMDAARRRAEAALTRQCLDAVLDLTTDPVWFKDVNGTHLRVNRAFCSLVGKSRRTVEGRGHSRIWNEPEQSAHETICRRSDSAVMASCEAGLFDEIVKAPQGMIRIKTRKTPLYARDGSVMGTVGIFRDVTKSANMSVELDLVLQSIPYAVIILDTQERIVNYNDKFRLLFGFGARETIVGESLRSVTVRAARQLDFKRRGKHIRMRSAEDGQEKYIEKYEKDSVDIFNNVVGAICIYRDITRQRLVEKRLRMRANTDDLTTLYNRHYFFSHVPAMVPMGAGLAYIDLDNFKHVNDRYGHATGNRALVLTARLLRRHLRTAVVARLGGDEFAAFFPQGDTAESLRSLVEGLRNDLIAAYEAHEPFRGLSASIGIVLVQDAPLVREDFVRRGDVAMYAAKHRGKSGCCFYSPSLDTTKSLGSSESDRAM